MTLPNSRDEEWPIERPKRKFNARQSLIIPPEFQESIATRGVLNYPWVTDDDFIIAGHLRIEAARLAGFKSIWVKVFSGIADGDFFALGLLENLARKDLEPYDTFVGLKAYRDACPNLKGKDIAKAVGLSEGMVSQYFALDKLFPEGMAAFRDGRLKVTLAYKVATSPDPAATLALFLGGETRDAVAQKTRAAKTSDSDTEKTEKLPVALSTGIVIIKAKKDKDGKETLNLAAARQLLVDAMAKVDNAIRLGYSAKTAAKAWDETKNRVPKPRKPRAAKGTS